MKLREATIDDGDAIADLCVRNGLHGVNREQWREFWLTNPCAGEVPGMPIGWLMEDGQARVVGSLNNIPLAYEYNGKPVRVAASGAWAVDPEHRSSAVLLLLRFLRQRGVDLLLTTTANAQSRDVLLTLKARRVPHPAYDEALFWIRRYSSFAQSALRKKGIAAAGLVKFPAAAALWSVDRLSGRNRTARDSGSVRRLDGFDDRFDEFWEALRHRPNRLLAVRDRATLTWHFKQRKRFIFGLEQDGRLCGYMVLIRADNARIGLRRLRVADWQVLDDDPQVSRALFAAAMRFARRHQADVVEIVGFSRPKRSSLEALRPHRRTLPTWPFLYKACNDQLRTALAREEAWDPSPYDGDASLEPRPGVDD